MNDRANASPGDGPHSNSEHGRALANALFNALLAALFSALFIQAGELPSSMWEPLGAGSFPRLILAALVLFNAALMVQSVLHLRRPPASPSTGIAKWFYQRRLAFATLAAFTLYGLLMPWLGFAPASVLFLFGVQFILGERRGRRLLIALLISAFFGIGLYLLFTQVFLISLPSGRLW